MEVDKINDNVEDFGMSTEYFMNWVKSNWIHPQVIH